MTLPGPPLSSVHRRRECEMECELLHLNRNLTNPISTRLTKMRIREPRVELESNPFCVEKQLADMYQQFNMNKNPRFFSTSVQDSAHMGRNPRNYSSFINQSADALASSHFDVRARAEFSTLPLATSYTPAVVQFTTPKVVSVDSGNIRKPSFGEYDTKDQLNKYIKTNTRRSYISSHDQYSVCMTSQGVTFGHRPNSAARMFDYLSDSVGGPNSSKRVCNKLVSRQFTSTPVRTGMSVMTLEHLLSSKKAANPSFIRKTRSIKAFGGETSTTFANSCEDFALVANESKRLDDIKKKKHELGLEKGFVNHVYNPQRGLKSVEYPPPDQTAAQLIDKYRKLAVGKQPRI